MWMGIAYLAGTMVLVSIVWGFGIEDVENLLNPWHLLTVLRGFVWVLGMAAYNLAIDKIGITRFNQWKNIQGPVGSLLILFIVADTVTGVKVLYLLLGVAVMFVSALMFQIRSDVFATNHTNRHELLISKNTKSGIAFALFSGVCFGVTALLNSVVSTPAIVGDKFTFAQLLYHSTSLILFSVIAYMIMWKQRFKDILKINKTILLPFTAGAMFLVATLLTIYSYRMIPNAVAWSITQLNMFWTVIIGIFILKEVNFKQHWRRLSAGVLTAIGACVLLFFAM
jgi:glucose uptake protein GlcU